MKLHKRNRCLYCCDAADDFDYCRACGFTVLEFEQKKQKDESPLERSVRLAGGADLPVTIKGFA